MNRSNEIKEHILKKLRESSSSISSQWHNPQNTNTKHFYIDDFLPTDLALEIYEAFPRDGKGFLSRESFREKKKTSADLNSQSPILKDITFAIQDPDVVKAFSKLVEMDELDPDPHLYAGGLSMMFKGDFLNPHIDNSHDMKRKKYRRLNLLYYVSKGWKEENGGHLELWNDDQTIPKTLHSKFNRLVAMETNKTSWHSVSPVTVDLPRCCVSNYYFSETSPDKTSYFHVTSFTGRPKESMKRLASGLDNTLRNIAAKLLKLGRGKSEINKDINS